MSEQVTNQTLNEILKRVEKKVDDYAINSINPQVFDLKIKELQLGMNQNSLDIIEIKKEMATDKKTEAEKDTENRQQRFGYVMACFISFGSAFVSGLIVYLLSNKP